MPNLINFSVFETKRLYSMSVGFEPEYVCICIYLHVC